MQTLFIIQYNYIVTTKLNFVNRFLKFLQLDEIVKEENMKSKNYAPFHTNIGNLDVYYYIEPVIDFEVTDKIVITDFKVSPLILERDYWKIN